MCLHIGLLLAWGLGGPLRVGSPSLATLVATGRWFPGAAERPLLLWGVLSSLSALQLLVGVWRRDYRIRFAGWISGEVTLATIAIAIGLSAAHDPRGSISGVIFVAALVGAHVAAASRERRE